MDEEKVAPVKFEDEEEELPFDVEKFNTFCGSVEVPMDSIIILTRKARGRKLLSLNHALREFTTAIRELGSFSLLVEYAYEVRKYLARVLRVFRENAADLFPNARLEEPGEIVPADHIPLRPPRSKAGPARKLRKKNLLHDERDDGGRIPELLRSLAYAFQAFRVCLNQIPDIPDEAINPSIVSFYADLRYWSTTLEQYTGQFRSPSVQRYLNDLTGEMCQHFDGLTEALVDFKKYGISRVREAQRRGAEGISNRSTVAALVAGVAATAIQFSYTAPPTRTNKAVNFCWVTALLFSLASAINSQLAYYWRTAIYQTSRSYMPFYISVWINLTPLLLLVLSGLAFMIGLICFTFSYFSQARFIAIFVTVCTSLLSAAFLMVMVWLMREGDKGRARRKSALEARIEATFPSRFAPLDWLTDAAMLVPSGAGNLIRAANQWKSQHPGAGVFNIDDPSVPNVSAAPGSQPVLSRQPSPAGDTRRDVNDSASHVAPRESGDLGGAEQGTSRAELPPEGALPHLPSQSVAPTPRRIRTFKNLVNRIVQQNQTSSGASRSPVVAPSKSPHEGVAQSISEMRQKNFHPPGVITESLKTWITIQSWKQNDGAVQHLQFSPNGRYLLCSWERRTVIRSVDESIMIPARMLEGKDTYNQVVWSPNSKYLLTRTARNIKIWKAEDGTCQKTIDRRQDLQSVCWMPNSRSFLYVDETFIYISDVGKDNDRVLSNPRLEHMRLAVAPDSTKLVVVGTLQSANGWEPLKSRPEKQIIVYNLGDLKRVSLYHQAPFLDSISDVTLSISGDLVLISYDDRSPHRLLQIKTDTSQPRLVRRCTYVTPKRIDFIGPAQFGDVSAAVETARDLFVLHGEIYIWDRQTGQLLHTLHTSEDGLQLNCMAWNQAGENQLMLAAGARDGTVRIWTASLPLPPQQNPLVEVPEIEKPPQGEGDPSPTAIVEGTSGDIQEVVVPVRFPEDIV
ncbi:uncharacterized protein EI90DRAFT_3121408 [Cantharellus anzutake]|uniref:uncharacterized protein n=1 Tax=Cantharellus anzutake TaxID=1750568 RepID=UPI001905E61B|nr:uncharacterized protein EI90DRAFT_3121408 [Cantharellus anzutake]KAF8334044.1 hypothetical protein EI90DRAFT_3121408 [Cantharellus anzutake]